MNSMIITNDSFTVARIATIAHRTHSELIAGAKSMMITGLKRQMRIGIAHFAYQKKDGTIREAWGTTCGTLVAKYTNGCGVSREYFNTTAYFDVEKAAWRSFRWESLIAVY